MTPTTVFIDKLPLCHSYIIIYFLRVKPLIIISGHQCTVTRRCVHLQVIKDPDVCLF